MNEPKYYIYGYTPYGDDGWADGSHSLEELKTFDFEHLMLYGHSAAWIYKVENNTLYHAGSWDKETGLILTEPEEVGS